jgi:precorrin-2 dehydrogenase / sirohydrochlorin ferrochelatase
MILYPILLNLEGELCTIVGGGHVARRKIEHLLEAGARVRVVSPRPHAEILRWARAGSITLERRVYDEEAIDPESRLVFACTDNAAVNRRVLARAKAMKIPANCVDDPASGDFHVPSMVRRGSLLLTVSTGGKAPGLSREICHRLQQQFGPAWGDFTDLLGRLRLSWKRGGESARIHGRLLEIIASDTFEVMQQRGAPAAARHARRLIQEREARTKRGSARRSEIRG